MKTFCCIGLLILSAAAALAQNPPTANPTQPALTPEQRAGQYFLRNAEFRFKSLVFADTNFPTGDFVDPASVREAIGDYTVHYRFFDAEFHEVPQPQKFGRYGTIVEIQGSNKQTDRRFVTLCRVPPEMANWQMADVKAKETALPKEFAVSPEVAKAYDAEFNAPWKDSFQDDMTGPDDVAVLLSAMTEAKGVAQGVVDRTGAAARNQLWWYELKKRLGLEQGYQYVVCLPPGYEAKKEQKFPLILLLHGDGDRGDDPSSFKQNPISTFLAAHEDLPFLVVVPRCPRHTWWNPALLMSLLDEVEKKYRVDADRIDLTGFSMGGYAAWETAVWYPQRFAAIVPIAGAGDAADMTRLKALPTWAFHNQGDDVVPLAPDAAGVEALKKVAGNVKMTVYPEMGHEAWTPAYANPELYKWLLQQHRAGQSPPLNAKRN